MDLRKHQMTANYCVSSEFVAFPVLLLRSGSHWSFQHLLSAGWKSGGGRRWSNLCSLLEGDNCAAVLPKKNTSSSRVKSGGRVYGNNLEIISTQIPKVSSPLSALTTFTNIYISKLAQVSALIKEVFLLSKLNKSFKDSFGLKFRSIKKYNGS